MIEELYNCISENLLCFECANCFSDQGWGPPWNTSLPVEPTGSLKVCLGSSLFLVGYTTPNCLKNYMKGHGKYLPQFADICSRSLKMKPLSVRLNLTYVFNAPWPKDSKYVSQFIVSGSVCAWEKSKAAKAAFNCLFHTKPKILLMKAMILCTIKGWF